ncbi:MAG: Gfo/Idh/MocA family oxidoreductase [Bacteroidota bacterium]|nr:Gfo/Idh/MocA family oxidoreductase [Bacteroidota bacterium]
MKKINVAICSFGMSGKLFHAPFIDVHPGFEIYAVWERSKKEAKEIYPAVLSCNNLNDLLQDDAIELIVVNTPNATHYDFTKRALLAGKHVIVEKPFTVTLQEAEELVELAGKVQRKLSVYHNRRWDSDFKTVKKVLASGVLGNIVDVEFHFDRYKKDLSPKVHKEFAAPGAGVLHDLGSHLIDSALQLFGNPSAVFGDLRKVRPVTQIDDHMDVILFYPQMRIRLKSGYLAKEPVPSFIIHGVNGSFLKPRTDIQELELQQGKIPGGAGWVKEPDEEKGLLHYEMQDGKVFKEKIGSESGNYMEYYNGIYNAIVDDAPLPVTANEGLWVMKIIDAVLESNRQKKIIEL